MPRGQFGSPGISLGSVVGNHADGKNALWRRRRSSRSRRFGKTGRGFRSNSRFFRIAKKVTRSAIAAIVRYVTKRFEEMQALRKTLASQPAHSLRPEVVSRGVASGQGGVS